MIHAVASGKKGSRRPSRAEPSLTATNGHRSSTGAPPPSLQQPRPSSSQFGRIDLMSNALSSDNPNVSNPRSAALSKEQEKSFHSSNILIGTRPCSRDLPETSMKRSETTPLALSSYSGLLDDPIVIDDSDEDSEAVYSSLVDCPRPGEASSSKCPTSSYKRHTSNACTTIGSSSRSELIHKKDKTSHHAKNRVHVGERPEVMTSNMSHPRPSTPSCPPPSIEVRSRSSENQVGMALQPESLKQQQPSQTIKSSDKGKQHAQDRDGRNKQKQPERTAPSTGSTTDALISTVSPRTLPAAGGSQARPHVFGKTARKTTSANRSRTRYRSIASGSTSSARHINPDPTRYLTALPAPKIPPKPKSPSPDWSRIPTHSRPLQGPEQSGEFETSLQTTWLREKKPDLSTSLGHLIYRENINSRQMWENPEIPRIEVVVPDNVKMKMVDPALAPPLEFIYTDRIVYRTEEKPIRPRWKCDCHGDCDNSAKCACREHQEKKIRELVKELAGDPDAQAMARDFRGFAYESDRRPLHSHKKSPDNAKTDKESRLVKKSIIEAKLPIFECNDQCGCGPDCVNRTVGRGRREKLNLQKTLNRGWGVFVDQTVTHRRLVAHYSGELITTAEQETRSSELYDQIGRTYIFSLDPWWMKTLGSGHEMDEKGYLIYPGHDDSTKDDQTIQKPIVNEEDHQELPDDPGVESLYSMDAFWYGNISRFINHSCAPNTTILPVYINDNDHTKPIFAMFANRMIKNGQEVTTSYSDPTSHEADKTDGINKTRGMKCECGARECAKVMFA